MTSMLLKSLLLLSVCEQIHSLVFSCEEVKYKLIGSKVPLPRGQFSIVVEENFTNNHLLQHIFLYDGKSTSVSFYDLSISSWSSGTGAYTVIANQNQSIDCAQEFTLIISNGDLPILPGVSSQPTVYSIGASSPGAVLVSPRAGMRLRRRHCAGKGRVWMYSGVDNGEHDQGWTMLAQWSSCDDFPEWIVTFDSVISIIANDELELEADSDLKKETALQSRDRVMILSSGASDNLQNLSPERNVAFFTACTLLQISWSQNLSVLGAKENVTVINTDRNGKISTLSFTNGTEKSSFVSHKFEVRYNVDRIQPQELSRSQETLSVSITAADPEPSSESTGNPYCQCEVDKFFMPIEWDPNEIWLDIIIILDTTEAMGATSLNDAGSLIESFFGDDFSDVLITDLDAPLSTRVGLISMADYPEVIFNLNMTKNDRVKGKVSVKKGVFEADVMSAFELALIMFNDGLGARTDRSDVRQVIYYMTDADPKTNMSPMNQFKGSQGVIIVNNFLEEGEVERPGLKDLASDGFFFSDLRENYMQSIQLFCKTNCFCKPEKDTYAGAYPDPTVRAAGGCYLASSGVTFSRARQYCSENGGGFIATVHDQKKAEFLNTEIAKVSSQKYFFWIGYSKNADGSWLWEDNTFDSYTNWDVNEPSSATVAKCAFVDQSQTDLPWAAGNCQIGFPYACEYTPCSVGKRDC